MYYYTFQISIRCTYKVFRQKLIKKVFYSDLSQVLMNYHTFCTQICTKVNLVHKKNTDETGEGETIITILLPLAILQDF